MARVVNIFTRTEAGDFNHLCRREFEEEQWEILVRDWKSWLETGSPKGGVYAAAPDESPLLIQFRDLGAVI